MALGRSKIPLQIVLSKGGFFLSLIFLSCKDLFSLYYVFTQES